MVIQSATLNDVEYISNALSKYFDEINYAFGFPKYKTEKGLMAKVVSERISDEQSEYKYMVAYQDGEPLGFINILLSQESPEILVVIGDNKKTKEELLKNAIEMFKEQGVSNVFGEISSNEDIESILQSMDFEIVQKRYKLKI